MAGFASGASHLQGINSRKEGHEAKRIIYQLACSLSEALPISQNEIYITRLHRSFVSVFNGVFKYSGSVRRGDAMAKKL
jgi:hypothetical protein